MPTALLNDNQPENLCTQSLTWRLMVNGAACDNHKTINSRVVQVHILKLIDSLTKTVAFSGF